MSAPAAHFGMDFSLRDRVAHASLLLVIASRMLGMFLVVPVFAQVARSMPGDQRLAGIALGAYAFTQAALMIPFSLAAGRWSLRAVAALGMAVFALGSAAAALATTLETLVVARALQGAGAVTGVAMTALASTSRGRLETTGDVVAISFALSLVLGPVLYAAAGFAGISWMLAAAAAVLAVSTWRSLPAQAGMAPGGSGIRSTLRSPQLWLVATAAVAAHATLMAAFGTVPLRLARVTQAPLLQACAYAAAAAFAFLFARALEARMADRAHRVIAGFVLLAASCAALVATSVSGGGAALVLWLAALLGGFQLLGRELAQSAASLPGRRDLAAGLYSTAQGAGLFGGAVLGAAAPATALSASAIGCIVCAAAFVALARHRGGAGTQAGGTQRW